MVVTAKALQKHFSLVVVVHRNTRLVLLVLAEVLPTANHIIPENHHNLLDDARNHSSKPQYSQSWNRRFINAHSQNCHSNQQYRLLKPKWPPRYMFTITISLLIP